MKSNKYFISSVVDIFTNHKENEDIGSLLATNCIVSFVIIREHTMLDFFKRESHQVRVVIFSLTVQIRFYSFSQ